MWLRMIRNRRSSEAAKKLRYPEPRSTNDLRYRPLRLRIMFNRVVRTPVELSWARLLVDPIVVSAPPWLRGNLAAKVISEVPGLQDNRRRPLTSDVPINALTRAPGGAGPSRPFLRFGARLCSGACCAMKPADPAGGGRPRSPVPELQYRVKIIVTSESWRALELLGRLVSIRPDLANQRPVWDDRGDQPCPASGIRKGG